MARAKMNGLISGLSGSIDKDHYARTTRDGKTIISLKPDFSNRQSSEGQLHVQGGMKAAAAYGKVACREHPIYAKLAKGTDKNAYNVAVGDWFNAPVIWRIEWNDGHIRVLANDDVMVTRVTVTILNDAGQRLEQADAELKTRKPVGISGSARRTGPGGGLGFGKQRNPPGVSSNPIQCRVGKNPLASGLIYQASRFAAGPHCKCMVNIAFRLVENKEYGENVPVRNT